MISRPDVVAPGAQLLAGKEMNGCLCVQNTKDGLEWALTVFSQGWVSIGMATLTDDADLGAFSMGRGFALETTPAQAMVWVSSVVQDELAGYEFVQWPSDGWRLLDPELRDGEAVWVDPSSDSVVSPIGAWCDKSERR